MLEIKNQAACRADSGTVTVLSSISFTFVLLLVLSTPFVEMSGHVSPGEQPYRIYGYGLTGLLQMALVMARGWQRSLRIYATAAAPFIVWAGLSLLWTQHIDLTSKRYALLVIVYAAIFGGICDLSHQRVMSILRSTLVAALILNFAAVFVAPDVGTHTGLLWRGLMAHKNIAGMLCAFTIIVFAFDGGKLPLIGRLPIILGALIFLIFSWSKTALITLPIALLAGGTIALFRERGPFAINITRKSFVATSRGVFALVIVALIILTVQHDTLLSFTDDTSTLTTRGAIWRPMIQFYLEQPLLGSGYGAYWDGSPTVIDQGAKNARLWKNVDQGHNGYLDLMVQVGLPSLALALYAAFVNPIQNLGKIIKVHTQRAGMIVALLVFTLIENLTESFLFADDALGNAFFLIALALLHHFTLGTSSQTEFDKTVDIQSPAQLREQRQKRQRTSLGS